MRSLILFLLLLTACNRGPPVPTATENRDLDEAAAMLDGADDALAGTDSNALDPLEPANVARP